MEYYPDVSLSVIYLQLLALTTKKITVQEKIRRINSDN